MYKYFFKPVFDVCIASIILIVLSPVFVLIILILLFANNGKPFFFQPRPGKNEKIFKVIKFKTMNDKKDASGNLLPAIQRRTSLGMFLRKFSLDEIPQLINVIKGDMSLIGPRPLRVEYLPLYSKRQRLRHSIKPGITGWSQLNGRNSLTWEKKFELDIIYVENMNFILDIKILLLTIVKVLKSENINQDENNITAPFGGIKLNN
jgi:lipopolysaccharide/colanic/teichoic acid biosynthesis glycosyltransferase